MTHTEPHAESLESALQVLQERMGNRWSGREEAGRAEMVRVLQEALGYDKHQANEIIASLIHFPKLVGKVDPMSSTTFEPVFRVGASGHPVETLDTGADGAGGAQQPRPGLLCPARAEKKLGSPTVLTDNTDRPGDDSRAPGAAARCYRS